MKIGILSIQGDISEHLAIIDQALKKRKIKGEVFRVNSKEDIREMDALVIPGGESTTISRFIQKENLTEEIKNLVKRGGAIMGTCAGAILLAKEGDDPRIKNLNLMDISVKRNSYGRQRESFEAPLEIKGIGNFSGIFIRAPVIEEVRYGEILATYEGKLVMVKQGNLLAVTFHPELTKDTKVHEYFLNLIGDG